MSGQHMWNGPDEGMGDKEGEKELRSYGISHQTTKRMQGKTGQVTLWAMTRRKSHPLRGEMGLEDPGLGRWGERGQVLCGLKWFPSLQPHSSRDVVGSPWEAG